jgi:hypothetical protein
VEAWPFTIFPTGVLRTITDALPKKARERFHFPAQEKLRDDIADRRLEKSWGPHCEPASLIGSNTLNLARLSTANVLAAAPPEEPLEAPDLAR